jgi:hypothetical protein
MSLPFRQTAQVCIEDFHFVASSVVNLGRVVNEPSRAELGLARARLISLTS